MLGGWPRYPAAGCPTQAGAGPLPSGLRNPLGGWLRYPAAGCPIL